MGSGLIGTGITGIQVAQLGLMTTEHNITNANTAGYNRQRIVQSSNIALATGAGYVGQGAHVSTIERLYDRFLSGQVNTTQTSSSELDTYYTQIEQIDNMLADTDAGVSPALQAFFSGVQDVASNPSQLPARQSMISSAQALVARYQGVSDRITEMYDGVNSQIASTVSTINSYSQQIAKLNEAIIVARSSNSQPPNDLLDQRDQLVLEMNKLVRVTTTTNSDGAFNVFIGTGQQLVVGTQVATMTALPSAADPSRLVVGLTTFGGNQELPESLITGGSLGGLLSFRSESLDRVSNDLGRNAVSLALTFNAQNSLGQDLLGNISGDTNFVAKFFNEPSPKVVANTLNSATSPTVSITYSAPTFNGNYYTNLTGSDYRLDYDGTTLTLTRLSDSTQWTGATVAALNTALTTSTAGPQGFTIDPATFVASAAGASYLIQPTRNAAGSISVNAAVAADPRLIAAAAPIRTQATTTNTGGASITAGSVAASYTSPAAATPVTLTYAAPVAPATTGTLSWPAAGTIPAGSVSYTSGATITIAGISFSISGTPAVGDTFTIAKNTSGVSDGRNALLLAKLQTQNTMSGQTATLQSAYAQLVSDVGNKTREVEVKSTAQSALLKQSQDARDALSGVNLDEEAANLMRFQQAYQASAKMLDIGSKLFDVLLAIRS